MSSILNAAGYRVGTYTSPHMHHLGERVAVGGQPLSPLEMQGLVQRYAPVLQERAKAEGGQLSHFEAVTALAFRWERLWYASMSRTREGQSAWGRLHSLAQALH